MLRDIVQINQGSLRSSIIFKSVTGYQDQKKKMRITRIFAYLFPLNQGLQFLAIKMTSNFQNNDSKNIHFRKANIKCFEFSLMSFLILHFQSP